MLTTLITRRRAERAVGWRRPPQQPKLIRERIGYVAQGGWAGDRREAGGRELVIQGRLYGLSRADLRPAPNDGWRSSAGAGRLPQDRYRIPAACGGGSTSPSASSQKKKSRAPLSAEPTPGPRPAARARIWDESEAPRQRMTIFITTHYPRGG